MVAVDTNVLIFAEISSSPHHARARALLTGLAEGALPWAIPWPCIYEFLRVVTHPRVFHPPLPMQRALEDVGRLLASPSLILLQETPNHTAIMSEVLRETQVSGNLVHDAHIAALCLEHGIEELLSTDQDFARFRRLRTRNPF